MKKRSFSIPLLALLVVLFALGPTAHGQTTVQITKQVTIQPIQVRSTDGSVAANSSLKLFEAETDRIWAQAGIDVKFLPVQTYNNSSYLNVSSNATDSNYLGGLVQLSGQPWVSGGSLGLATTVIRLFFVQSIDNDASVLGFALQSGISNGGFGNVIQQKNGIAISDSAFSFNGGIGRLDVIAHELGHNLGLDHDNLGAGGGNNLMSSPRATTASLFDIGPGGNGNNYDQLTGTIGGTNVGSDSPLVSGFQIDRARAMTNAVNLGAASFTYTYTAIPEPATASLITGAALIGFVGMVRLKKRRNLCSRPKVD